MNNQNTHTPLVTIQIVVHNGERYIRHCLDAVGRQTYRNLEVVVLDNASTDATATIIAHEYPNVRLFRHEQNLGMWPGQEHLLTLTTGEMICALSVDVILDSQFIERGVVAFGADTTIGAVQGKLFQYNVADVAAHGSIALTRARIDTCGFGMTRGRTVRNIGHGEPDGPSFCVQKEIFGVEGAVPLFRRTALTACRMDGWIWDPDYFWYSDDLDLAWRMHMFGFRQIFDPMAVAWHDRSTTKGAARIPIIGQLKRIRIRQAIPLIKRRLGWSNDRFTIVKNDYSINVLRDAPYIFAREIAVLGYTVLFEPHVLAEWRRFLRLLPRMIRRRRRIMQRAVVSPSAMHRWFI